MLKAYIDYRREEIAKLYFTNVSVEEINDKIQEFNDFLSRCFKVNEEGRLIVTKELVTELGIAIKENKIPLVLDELDMSITVDDSLPNGYSNKFNPFRRISDLVCVHISNYPFSDDTIKTPESTGLEKHMHFVDPNTGLSHEVSYPVRNDTIHFTLNCPVHNHEVGNDWDSFKYGVLVGLDKLDKDSVLDLKSEDTFLDGDVILGDEYYLLCPFGEKDKLQKMNPKATIIEYKDITLSQAIQSFIILSGKKLESYGSYGWGKDYDLLPGSKDIDYLEELAIREKYPVLKNDFGYALHSETKYMASRMWKREYEMMINLFKYMDDNNIQIDKESFLALLNYNGAYVIPGNVPVSINEFKRIVIPIFEKYGYEFDYSIFEDLDFTDGLKVITKHDYGEYSFSDVICPEWEDELRVRLVDYLSKMSKNLKFDKNKQI